jgi:hypothetical protein
VSASHVAAGAFSILNQYARARYAAAMSGQTWKESWADIESPRSGADGKEPEGDPASVEALTQIAVGTLSTISCVHSLICLEHVPKRGIVVTASSNDVNRKLTEIASSVEGLRARYCAQPTVETRRVDLLAEIERTLDILDQQPVPFTNEFLISRSSLATARLISLTHRSAALRENRVPSTCLVPSLVPAAVLPISRPRPRRQRRGG